MAENYKGNVIARYKLDENTEKPDPVSYTHLDVYKRQTQESEQNIAGWSRGSSSGS